MPSTVSILCAFTSTLTAPVGQESSRPTALSTSTPKVWIAWTTWSRNSSNAASTSNCRLILGHRSLVRPTSNPYPISRNSGHSPIVPSASQHRTAPSITLPSYKTCRFAKWSNLLKHRNPYTHLTYAEDPAVAFVEIINEQSILFYTSMAPLKASPTLRDYVGKRFCDWLREKYRSQIRWPRPGAAQGLRQL